MPIRFYVPLPGPFVWVPGVKRQRNDSPPLTEEEARQGGVLLLGCVLFLPVILAVIWAVIGGYYIHPVVGVLVNIVEVTLVVWLVRLRHRRSERRRRIAEREEIAAAEAELQAEIDAEEAERARQRALRPPSPPRWTAPPPRPPDRRYGPGRPPPRGLR